MTMSEQVREQQRQAGKQAFIDGLREMADYLETSELDLDFVYRSGLNIDVFTWNEDTFKEQSRMLGGFREKVLEGSYANTRRRFGPHKIDVTISREQICERVQVGVKTVPAQEEQPERTEPEYEWRCEGFEVVT